jgi:hypothetical protein
MFSQNFQQQLNEALAKASEIQRNGLWETSGNNGTVKLRDPSPLIALLQCVHDARNVLQEAEKLGNNAITQEAVVILEKIVEIAEKMEEESDNLNRRMDRLTRRLGG